MDLPPSKREVPLHGPKPPPLHINQISIKIKKPPIAHKAYVPHAPPQSHQHQQQQPMIIYSVSPKPIFVDSSNFMSIVQRLTGNTPVSPDCFPRAFDAPPSPAARFAAIEQASPNARAERERRREDVGNDLLLLGSEERENDVIVGSTGGILSPAPANLPVLNEGIFATEAVDGRKMFGEGEWLMSPLINGFSFTVSPSSLFYSLSPTTSPSLDFFNNIFDN